MKNKYTTKQVETLFDSIARTYDFLNHFLSGGMDFYWRRQALKFLGNPLPGLILDVACGTGDFAIAAAKYGCKSVVGIDISESMLKIAREKINREILNGTIELVRGNAENLPFENCKFDAIIVAFGVRNFYDLSMGLSEMRRVLKDEGKFIILEFSKPKNFIFSIIYFFYFKYVLPLIGKIVSKNYFAYRYLPETVASFPEREDFKNILQRIGFKNITYELLTFGIVTIYSGTK